MKKTFVVLVLLLTIALSGCQGAKAPEQNNTPATSNQEPVNQSHYYQYGTPVEVDNVIFTITGCIINSVKGDRTADNYTDANGEYFAIGSDIVKAADYEEIEISISVENKSDMAINFSEVGWEAKLPDGYKFEQVTVDGKIGEQMPSNYKADGTVVIIKEKAIQAEQLQLTYNLMDYNEEWQGAIWKAMSGELTEKEYKAKFNPQPVTFELKL